MLNPGSLLGIVTVESIHIRDIQCLDIQHVIARLTSIRPQMQLVGHGIQSFQIQVLIQQIFAVIAFQANIQVVERGIHNRFVELHRNLAQRVRDNTVGDTQYGIHFQNYLLQTEHQRVGGRQVIAERIYNMQFVFIDRIRPDGKGDKSLPHVAERNHLLVAVAGAADELVLATTGIPGLLVVPTDAGRIQRENHNRVLRGYIVVEAYTVGGGHIRTTAVGEVESVRIVVVVLHIVHEEVVDAVVQISIGIDGVDERVDGETAHKTEVGVAEAVVVDHVRLIGDKVAEQRAGEPPLPYSRMVRLDIAERYLHQA